VNSGAVLVIGKAVIVNRVRERTNRVHAVVNVQNVFVADVLNVLERVRDSVS
jgi:hypothetical protein